MTPVRNHRVRAYLVPLGFFLAYVADAGA